MPTNIGKPTNTLTWSDGSNFSGYVRIQISLPSGYDQAFIISNIIEQMIPLDYIFPVNNGVIDNSIGVWYNSDISPFGTTYAWSAYDTTFKLISGPSASFTVSSSSFTLPSLTISTSTPAPTMPLNTYQYYQFTGGNSYTPNIANGMFHEVYLNRETTTINSPIYTNGTLVSGQRLIFIFFRDNASTSTERNVSMSTDYLWANGSLDASGMVIMPDVINVQNIAEFVLQPTGKWLNIGWLVGVPRS